MTNFAAVEPLFFDTVVIFYAFLGASVEQFEGLAMEFREDRWITDLAMPFLAV